jgi:hypothetical protein
MRTSVCLMTLAAVCGGPVFAQTVEPRVERRVLEDDGVRIEELRVRGQTQRIVVTPKVGVDRAYEILPVDASRDPSQGRGGSQGVAGQRVWHVLSF